LEFGRVEYVLRPNGAEPVKLRLTLVGQSDDEVLRRHGLRELRLRRILRLTQEARSQGVLLGYEDLCGLLLCSLATLKRDIAELRARGQDVPLRLRNGGRR
jgi:hypothetical protein